MLRLAKLDPARQQAAVDLLKTKPRLKDSDLTAINCAARAAAASPAGRQRARPAAPGAANADRADSSGS